MIFLGYIHEHTKGPVADFSLDWENDFRPWG